MNRLYTIFPSRTEDESVVHGLPVPDRDAFGRRCALGRDRFGEDDASGILVADEIARTQLTDLQAAARDLLGSR